MSDSNPILNNISDWIYSSYEAAAFYWRRAQMPAGFSEDARQEAGYQLDQVQRGEQPADFKPMPSIGAGVEEIRVRDESGAYRVIYIARFAEAVFVLHAFPKKTQATAKRDIDIAKERLAQLMRGRR